MSVLSPEVKTAVATDLLGIGLCKRCVLRFVGERYSGTYEDPEHAFAHIVGTPTTNLLEGGEAAGTGTAAAAETPAKQADAPCTACLGFLQIGDDFAEKLAASVLAGDRKFESFSLSIVHPIEMHIRDFSIHQYLVGKYPHFAKRQWPNVMVPTVKDAFQWICRSKLVDKLHAPYQVAGKVELKLVYTHPATEDDWKFFIQMDPNRFKPRRKKRSRDGEMVTPMPTLNLVTDSLGEKHGDFQRFAKCPPEPITHAMAFPEVTGFHQPVFLAGRYTKHSRELSQTPWLIEGVRKSEHSVEELVGAQVVDQFKADSFKFSASGREDVDVRTLGRGRPFALEIINARKPFLPQDEVTSMQTYINSRDGTAANLVKVRDLQMIEKVDLNVLKDGESSKRKEYCCIVWLSKDIDKEGLDALLTIKDLTLKQETPIRVLHRRNLAIREKVVHWMKYQKLKPNFIKLWLNTQAGTYIKEFIHGDFARTSPSLGTILGCKADILSLDVMDVVLDWPPAL